MQNPMSENKKANHKKPINIYFDNMTSLPQITVPGWEEGNVQFIKKPYS